MIPHGSYHGPRSDIPQGALALLRRHPTIANAVEAKFSGSRSSGKWETFWAKDFQPDPPMFPEEPYEAQPEVWAWVNRPRTRKLLE